MKALTIIANHRWIHVMCGSSARCMLVSLIALVRGI